MSDPSTLATILPAGTVLTASGSTGPLHVTSDVDADGITVAVDVSAVSGTTPSLTVSVAWDADANSDTSPPVAWGTATSSAAITAAGRTTVTLPYQPATSGTTPRYYKVSWAITGTTPSFTLGMYGE